MNNVFDKSEYYQIQLDDETCWNVTVPSAELQPWIGRLAKIMELDASSIINGNKRICFITSDNGKTGHTFRPEPSDNGWTCHDLISLCVWDHDISPEVICTVKPFDTPETEIVTMWNALYPVYRESIRRGGLPFHAGLVELDGRGVILAAPGNTGKSTCCRRLPDYWNPLCDDEALVVVDNEGIFRAHPFPTWSDYLWRGSEKSWNVQRSVPVSGVFFIEQSEDDEAIALGEGKAAVHMNESATQVCRKYWRKADDDYRRTFRRNLFVNASEMAKKIPAYRLRVSLHGRFWEEIERVLGW